jgi:hypothetical protein
VGGQRRLGKAAEPLWRAGRPDRCAYGSGVLLSLAAAIAAAACFGVANVLQAVAARSTPTEDGVHPRLVLRLARQLPFAAGVALDLVGFAAHLTALRHLPLFVVQATISFNLAVTAVVASRVLRLRLSSREWLAVGAACLGLALLAVATGPESPVAAAAGVRIGLWVAVVVVAGCGFAAGRLHGVRRAAVLGMVAGLGFSVVAVAARTLTSLAPARLVHDSTAYALAAGGVLAFLCFVTALQTGMVTVTTAATVVTETVAPAAVGVWSFGDTTRPHFAVVAGAGFVVAVAGALALAGFGDLAEVASEQQSEQQ